MDRCEAVRAILAERGSRETLPDEVVAHLQQCPECGRLWAAYGRSIQAYRAGGPGSAPSASDVAALLERTRRYRARRKRSLVAAAMAACIAAAIVGVVVSADRSGAPAPSASAAAPDVSRSVLAGDPAPELTGDATIQIGEGPKSPVAGTAAVEDGRTVRTGSGEAVLADATTARVSLAPRTLLKVERWHPDRSVLWLEEGSLEAQVQHRAPGEVFEVRTPLAIVRVVGTRFVVSHRPEGGTEIVGLEGEVTVEAPDGTLVARVTPGRSVRLGAPPPDPSSASAVAAMPPSRFGPRPAVETREPAEPVVPDVLVAEARRLLVDGRDGEALDLLRKAVEASTPGDAARVLAALAEAYRLAGRPVDAAAAFERCLSAGPGPAPESAFVGYADLLVSQGRAADAARTWAAYVRAWPAGRHLGRALRERAAFAEMEGRADEATELRRQLVRDAPRSKEAVEVFVDLGLRMARGGDRASAAAWFEAKRDAESRDLAEAAWVGLMRVRFEDGRFGEVRTLADQYRRHFPMGARRDEVTRLVRALPDGSTDGNRSAPTSF